MAMGESIWSGLSRRRAAGSLKGGLMRLADTLKASGGVPIAIALPDGAKVEFGAAPRVVLSVRDPSILSAFSRPTLGALAEAFIDGRLDIDGDLLEAMPLAERLVQLAGVPVGQRAAAQQGRHSRGGDKEAIGFHYDVGNDFYRLWLDERMVYSCAYFRTPELSLDAAQVAKLDHICRKLRLAPGERFLDVGCGWGGLVIHAATHYGVRAVGITLSAQQLALATERVAAAGLSDRIELLLLDYRELPARFGAESFDKIASIGMFEHVGLRRLPEYFGAVATVLRDRGLFLNHGITSTDVEGRRVGSGVGDFMDRHVFPESELPPMHVAAREMAAAGLEVTDVESLRPHYARTLAHWARGLERRREEAVRMTSERIVRTWRIYLAGCSHGFQQGWLTIYQLLASRQATPGASDLPLTREWIYR